MCYLTGGGNTPAPQGPCETHTGAVYWHNLIQTS